MMSPRTDPVLREWILADMSAAPPTVALSAMTEMMSQYMTGEAATIFDEISIPVMTVNGDLWPIDYEANRRHMVSFDAVVIEKADHFLMMARPEEFNRALEKAIHTVSTRAKAGHTLSGGRRDAVEPRLNIITLGVKNMERAIRFYRDGLGWPMSGASVGDFAVFRLRTGTALALFPRDLLAMDANVEDAGGFGGITLAQNVATREEVDSVLSGAVKAGGTLLKKAREAEWGGYSGYFADPDGHPWEVAWNPHFRLEQGILSLPQ